MCPGGPGCWAPDCSRWRCCWRRAAGGRGRRRPGRRRRACGDAASTSVLAFPPDSDDGSDLGSRLASMRSMPGITIEFTEQELAELRAEAKEKGVAIKRL